MDCSFPLEEIKVVMGNAPTADLYAGSPASDVIVMENYDRVVFLIHQKTSTSNTGKATVTVEACDDTTPSNTSAIAFKYRINESFSSSDTLGALTAAAAAGFSTTANKTALYAIEVRADQLPDGYPNVRIKMTETTDDPVIGSVIALCFGGRKKGATLPTAIA